MNILTKLKIKFFYQKVGIDEFGNQYFQDKNSKRFVLYNGIAEASKVPAEWHGWLHYTLQDAPLNINAHRYSWQKTHLPNLTGTKNSYSPKKSSAVPTYEAWNPPIK